MQQRNVMCAAHEHCVRLWELLQSRSMLQDPASSTMCLVSCIDDQKAGCEQVTRVALCAPPRLYNARAMSAQRHWWP